MRISTWKDNHRILPRLLRGCLSNPLNFTICKNHSNFAGGGGDLSGRSWIVGTQMTHLRPFISDEAPKEGIWRRVYERRLRTLQISKKKLILVLPQRYVTNRNHTFISTIYCKFKERRLNNGWRCAWKGCSQPWHEYAWRCSCEHLQACFQRHPWSKAFNKPTIFVHKTNWKANAAMHDPLITDTSRLVYWIWLWWHASCEHRQPRGAICEKQGRMSIFIECTLAVRRTYYM